MKLHLGLGPRHRRDAVDGDRVAVPVSERQQGFARGRNQRPETDADARSGHHPKLVPQAEDRVEHGTDRIAKRPTAGNGGGIMDRPSAADESRAVGFILYLGGHFAVDDAQMSGPDLGVGSATAAASCQQGPQFRHEFGCHEQRAERRVCHVVGLPRQHEFAIGCDFENTGTQAMVGDGNMPELGVVLWRYQHVHRGFEVAVEAGDATGAFRKDHFILVGLDRRRLETGGPDFAAFDIADENGCAATLAGDILAPARDSDVVPAGISRSGRGQHRRQPAIGQQMSAWHPRVRRGISTIGVRRDGLGLLGTSGQFGWRASDREVARHPFLQQQFRRAHHRFGMKALAHAAVVEGIADADQHHRLMVGHIGFDDCKSRCVRQAGAREIERFVPAVDAPAAHSGHLSEVCRRRPGIDHRTEAAGIRRDHQVVAKPALVAEIGDAEAGILISLLGVANVVFGFRNSPRHTALGGVIPLPPDD